MKMSSILLLLVVGLLPACRTAYSFSIYNPPPEEWVRTSDVIVTAKPRAAVRQGERCVAQFTVEEVLKGRFSETILTVPMYVEIKEKPCSGITIISGIENRIDWNKDIGSTYLLFLRRINGGFDFPGFYNVSSLAMIENIERLIAIEAADNADEKKALYLEIFHSGEDLFFLSACNELINLKADKSILEKTLLDRWERLEGLQKSSVVGSRPKLIGAKPSMVIPPLPFL